MNNWTDQITVEMLNSLSKQELLELEKLLKPSPKLYESSLHEFVRQGWKYVESAPFIDNWHIGAIAEHLQAVTSGQITNLLINIPPGCSKPVWEMEWVLEKTKGRIRLRDVSVGDFLLTHRGRFRKVLDVFKQGKLPLLKITTHTGRVVRTAADHPFLTPRGWVQAQNLQDGDMLACVAPKSPCGTVSLLPEEARLLGYLIGDGSCKYQTSVFTNENEAVLNDFENCAAKLGFKTRRKVKPGCKIWTVVLLPTCKKGKKKWIEKTMGPHPVWTWLKRHGLWGADSYTKQVPKAILQATPELVGQFIGAYWSCDGFIAKRGGSRTDCVIGADSVSNKLLRGVQHLLCRLGIMARLRKKQSKIKSKRQGDLYVSWSLTCSTLDHGSKFAERVPIVHSLKANELKRFNIRSGFDRVLYEDPLVEVSKIGVGECRCLRIEQDNSFVVNDIAVHNSLLVCVFWPAWEWTLNPAIRWFFTSYDQRLATRDSVKCRALISSPWYQKNWGKQFSITSDQKTYYETTKQGYRMATSVGGHGTGEHPDRIVSDDPNNVREAESELERTNLLNYWSLTLSSRGVSRKVKRVVVMQRLHEDDLSGHILSKHDEDWTVICLPMRYEPNRMKPTCLGWNDPRKVEGELLTPLQFDEKSVSQLERDLGAYGTAGQLQQRPSPKGGGMFRSRFFQQRVKAAPFAARRVIYWDRAFSVSSSACFTVGTMMAVDDDGNYYVGPVKRGRWYPEERDQEILGFARASRSRFGPKYEPTTVVEQEPSAGVDSFRHLAKKLVGFSIQPDPVRKNKELRADPWASQIAAGNVILVDDGTWDIDAWIAEHCAFPNGRFVDMVDSAAGAFAWLHRHKANVGTFRVMASSGKGEGKSLKLIIASRIQLQKAIIEEKALLIHFDDPEIPKEVMCNVHSESGIEVTVEGVSCLNSLPSGGMLIGIHEANQGKPPPSFTGGIAQLIGSLRLEFADLDPAEHQAVWDQPMAPWGKFPAELVMNREHAKGLWNFIRRKRDDNPEVIIFVDEGKRGLSAAMAVSDQLDLKREKDIWEWSENDVVDVEKLKGKAPNPHVFAMTKAGRLLVY